MSLEDGQHDGAYRLVGIYVGSMRLVRFETLESNQPSETMIYHCRSLYGAKHDLHEFVLETLAMLSFIPSPLLAECLFFFWSLCAVACSR